MYILNLWDVLYLPGGLMMKQNKEGRGYHQPRFSALFRNVESNGGFFVLSLFGFYQKASLGLLPSEMVHTVSIECVSPWINLLSLYYGSLLNSSLREAKNPRLLSVPGTCLWPGMWPSSPAPLSFLQHSDGSSHLRLQNFTEERTFDQGLEE